MPAVAQDGSWREPGEGATLSESAAGLGYSGSEPPCQGLGLGDCVGCTHMAALADASTEAATDGPHRAVQGLSLGALSASHPSGALARALILSCFISQTSW